MSPTFFSFAARFADAPSPPAPASRYASTAPWMLNLYFFSHFAASVDLSCQLMGHRTAHEAPVMSRNSFVIAFSLDLVSKRGYCQLQGHTLADS